MMELDKCNQNNHSICTIEGNVPALALEKPCLLGIDEAGRGPVLGPMVYGTCYSPLSLEEDIKQLGFADSKTLTEEQREDIFEKINLCGDKIGWIVEIISPNYISNCMLRRSKYNLNALSHDTAIGLIQKALDKGVKLKEVYVDTVGDPAKYQAKLKSLFPDLDITVAKKADATYSIVGAASICAKVARDKALRMWKFPERLEVKEYGSGYPADPQTKKFLKVIQDPVFGFPQIVRFSWSTAYTILNDSGVPVHWDDDSQEESETLPVNSIDSFFHSNSKKKELGKHRFFAERCLHQVDTF